MRVNLESGQGIERPTAPWIKHRPSAWPFVSLSDRLRIGLQAPCWTLSLLLVAALLGAVSLPPYPPLQDFSEWIYQGYVASRSLLGRLPAIDFAWATYPVPNSITQAMLSAASLVMPPVLAGSLLQVIYILVSAAMAVQLSRRFQPSRAGATTLVLMISIFFGSTFWNGYSNFQIGLLVFSSYLLVDEKKRLNLFPVMLFSIGLFFCHAIVFIAFVTLVFCEACFARRLLKPACGVLPAAALVAWYLQSRPESVPLAAYEVKGVAQALAYKAYTLSKFGPYQNFAFAIGGDEVRRPFVYWTGIAANIGYLASLLFGIGYGAVAAFGTGRAKPAPLLTALVLASVAFLLPNMVNNLVNPGERFLAPALLLLLLFLPIPDRVIRLLGVGGFVVLMTSILSFADGRIDWEHPVSRPEPQEVRRTLYLHWPSAFHEQLKEIERSASEGRPVRVQLIFDTSLLLKRSVTDRKGGEAGGQHAAP